MVVNTPVEYSEPDADEALNEALRHEPDRYNCSLPCSPPPQKVVLFCPLPGQVCHLKWWLTKFSADHIDIFYLYAEMGNDECTEMQLNFHDLPNPSIFVTWPKVGGVGLTLTASNHGVLTQKFWVLNEQCQAFRRNVRLGQNRVPHTWLLNNGAGEYDSRASDLHQHSGVAQMIVLHGLMSRSNMTTAMIYCVLECPEDQMKQCTEHADFVPSDGEDEW